MPSFDPAAILATAQSAEKSGEVRTASSLYAKVAVHYRKEKQIHKAKTLLEKCRELTPHSTRLLVELALCEKLLGHIEQGRSFICEFAKAYLERKQTESYLEYMERALTDHPDLRALFFEEILRIERNNPQYYLALAECEKVLGNYSEAQKTLLRLLKLSPRHAKACVLLIELFKGEEKKCAAVQRYEMNQIELEDLLLEINRPRHPQTGENTDLSSLIHQLEKDMGLNLQSDATDLAPLIKEFRERAGPVIGSDAKARLDLGLAFFQMELFAEAKAELSQITPENRLYLEAQTLVAEVLHEEGETLKALDILQCCLRAGNITPPVRDAAQYRLATLFLRLGDHESSLMHLKEINKRSPGFRNIRDLLSQLEQAS